jgi:Gnt-I system high-affinity gluconate transporter
LLPVLLLIGTTGLLHITQPGTRLHGVLAFAGDAPVVMLCCLLFATFSLGTAQQRSLKDMMNIYAEAVKDIAMVMLIIAGSGALKEVLAGSGVSAQIAVAMSAWHIPVLVLGWLMAAVIRACIGSATVAGLTAAGMMAPLIAAGQVEPNLMVLSVAPAA